MFQAERAAAARARRDADAAREFAENAEFFKNTEALAAKDRASARYKRELAFMYQKPPGFDAALEREKAEKAKAAARDAEAARGAEETAARVAAGLPPLSAEQIARRKKRKMRRDADGRNVAAADAFPELAGAPRVAPRAGASASRTTATSGMSHRSRNARSATPSSRRPPRRTRERRRVRRWTLCCPTAATSTSAIRSEAGRRS